MQMHTVTLTPLLGFGLRDEIVRLGLGLGLGLAHDVVDNGQGLDRAIRLARQTATKAPTSNHAVINGIARIAEMVYAEGLAAETVVTSATGATGADAGQRIRGFFDGSRQAAEPNA